MTATDDGPALCSCYPWPVLGLPPSWYKDPAYRARVVKEPRAVLSEMGLELDDDVRITVHDSTSEVRWRRRHGRRPVRDGRVHLAADEVSARAHALARRSPGHDHRDGHSNVHEA
ncbi:MULTISPECIES: nitrile hydratase subunit alpha [Streptomyces violaceusniger group]|uniref:Nitrile hydratase alpha/Thiocyanate hydrolase gamma domain-containing protein n=1 Tax=Streptomyces rhizosphaericus TaxID=114699 RepID=A0ABP3ZYI7_9ACTN